MKKWEKPRFINLSVRQTMQPACPYGRSWAPKKDCCTCNGFPDGKGNVCIYAYQGCTEGS